MAYSQTGCWLFALLDSLLLVAERFDGPSNVETVIGTIHTKIAEAISNMQENKDSITAKVKGSFLQPQV